MIVYTESKADSYLNFEGQSPVQILGAKVKAYAEQLEKVDSPKGLAILVLSNFAELCKAYIKIGDAFFHEGKEKLDANKQDLFTLHFDIPEVFKDVAILHRDTALQLQIAKHKDQESSVSEEKLMGHFEASKIILTKAVNTLYIKFRPNKKSTLKSEIERRGFLTKMRHQANPWEVYKEQYQTLIMQYREIAKSEAQVAKMILAFNDIIDFNTKLSHDIITEDEILKTKLSQLIGLLKKTDAVEKISETISYLDSALEGIEKNQAQQDIYTETIALRLESFKELNIPVGSNNGLLLNKKIDFNKVVKKWLDYEVLPMFIDVWDNHSNMVSYFKHSLLNLKNSLILIKTDDGLGAIDLHLQTVKNSHSTIHSDCIKQETTAKGILQKLSKEFKVTNIYSVKPFLEVSLQSSLTHFTSDQKSLLHKTWTWAKNLFSMVGSKYEKAKVLDGSKALEHATSCIQYRMFKEENAHYDTLFLNKNFIGNLFIAERTDQVQKIESILEQWKQGFNKSALITGNALCGKTTFMEQVSKKYSEKATIHLAVDHTISAEGRKFKTTRNLGNALSEVKKAVYNSQPLLVLDDLEKWQGEEVSLLDNIRALLQFIESESDTVFVMVSTSAALQYHLDQRLRFSQTFSNTIDLNKARQEEIYKAIIVRHGASHKKLVTKEGELYSAKQIQSKIQNLSKTFGQNIGEVLQAWTYGTSIIDSENVLYLEQNVPFYDFFTDEEVILLKYVLLHKYTNEIVLKHFFGRRFNDGFQSGLRRLISSKVLLRQDQGSLCLNQVLYHDIYKILKYRGTLN